MRQSRNKTTPSTPRAAEALGRFERYLVLAPSLLLSIPWVGIWIIAVFANITAVQRILDIRRQARER